MSGPTCGLCACPVMPEDEGFCPEGDCRAVAYAEMVRSHEDDRLERAWREEMAGREAALTELAPRRKQA